MTPSTMHPITIRPASVSDARLLATIAAATFIETFAADNAAADMAAYVEGAFGELVQQRELLDARNTALFAEREGDVVGYAMLREGEAPACVGTDDAIELARLYARQQAIGSGVGAALMAACVALAAARGRRTLWLGVWEHNARAIAFYQRWGFTDAGSHDFQLGTDRQTDRIMTRLVCAAAEDACAIR